MESDVAAVQNLTGGQPVSPSAKMRRLSEGWMARVSAARACGSLASVGRVASKKHTLMRRRRKGITENQNPLAHYHDASRHYLMCKHASKDPSLRVRLYLILEEPSTSVAALVFGVFSSACVIAALLLQVLETVAGLLDAGFVKRTQLCFNVIFTIEVVLRIAVTMSGQGTKKVHPSLEGPSGSAIPSTRHLTSSFYFWADIVAVVPFYIEMILESTSLESFTDIISLLRLLRILVP